jgi:hypothetical protein
MQPPAMAPLIQGSSTPSANDVATAASTASPPAASTAAPTCAAFLCCEATTPCSVAMTVLRTTCALERLSFIGCVHPCSLACRTTSAWVANQTLPSDLACRISCSRIQMRER